MSKSKTILEELQTIIAGIDAKRKEITQKLGDMEAELRAKQLGRTFPPVGFDITEVLDESDADIGELKSKIAKLKIAQDLPNYIDKDFREKSLVYVSAIAAEAQAELDANMEAIHAAQKAAREAKQLERDLAAERIKIHDRFYFKIREIGLGDVWLGTGSGAKGFLDIYKRECSQYE